MKETYTKPCSWTIRSNPAFPLCQSSLVNPQAQLQDFNTPETYEW